MNDIIHPKVLTEMQEIVDKSKRKVLIYEVPLLFETDLVSCFDFIVLVTAEEQTRINRLVKFKNLDNQEALARIKAQMDDKLKMISSDFVVNNESSLPDLRSHAEYLSKLIPNLPFRQITTFKQKAEKQNKD
jgi:dephospho-CoA kinase